MPAGLIGSEVPRERRRTVGDFNEVQMHRLGIAEGQNEGSTGSVFGADRTEDVGRLGALIAWTLGDASRCLAQRW